MRIRDCSIGLIVALLLILLLASCSFSANTLNYHAQGGRTWVVGGVLNFTGVNAAGGSANPFDYTGTLGIMDAVGTDNFTLFDINLTNANHTGGTVEIMNIANITGDAQATENGINIGTGWDNGITCASPVTFNGGITCDTDKFTVADTSGNTRIGGTATIIGHTYIGNANGYAGGGTTLSSAGAGSFSTTLTVDGQVTTKQSTVTTYGNGAIVANKCTVSEGGIYPTHQSTLTFTLEGDHDIDVADGGKTTGVKVYDFPAGRVLILGATCNASITTNNVYNANPNDVYYVSVGTADGTQAADADLTSTEQDIITKTTIDTVGSTTLTADWHGASGTGIPGPFDGTTTAAALYVNVAVPDTSNTGPTTHAITGTLVVTWINLGDY